MTKHLTDAEKAAVRQELAQLAASKQVPSCRGSMTQATIDSLRTNQANWRCRQCRLTPPGLQPGDRCWLQPSGFVPQADPHLTASQRQGYGAPNADTHHIITSSGSLSTRSSRGGKGI